MVQLCAVVVATGRIRPLVEFRDPNVFDDVLSSVLDGLRTSPDAVHLIQWFARMLLVTRLIGLPNKSWTEL